MPTSQLLHGKATFILSQRIRQRCALFTRMHRCKQKHVLILVPMVIDAVLRFAKSHDRHLSTSEIAKPAIAVNPYASRA